MSGHLKYVLTADMSPDEKMLVTGGGNKALNLWVVTSGRLIGHMQGHTSDIESVQFSPNGRVVVSAGEDNSVKIWSVDNQQELAMLVFQKNGNQYAGVTFDNRAFGDRNSGLLSVYINGKQASPSEAEHVVEYIGRGIVIMGHLEKFLSPSRHESDSVTARGHGRMERAGHGAEGLFRC